MQQSFKLAYVWLSIAAANGHPEAFEDQYLIIFELDSKTLAEADELINEHFELFQQGK